MLTNLFVGPITILYNGLTGADPGILVRGGGGGGPTSRKKWQAKKKTEGKGRTIQYQLHNRIVEI